MPTANPVVTRLARAAATAVVVITVRSGTSTRTVATVKTMVIRNVLTARTSGHVQLLSL